MDSSSRQSTIYLIQEAILFLFLSYLVLLGGTFNGLVIPVLKQISLIFLVVIGLAWFIYRVFNNRVHVNTGLDTGILLILTAGIISTVFSVDPRRSLIYLVILVVAILIYYLFVDLIEGGLSSQLINKVILLVSGFMLFFGVRELVIWYGGWIQISGVFEQIIPPATYRVRSFIGHPNFLAAYLNLLIPIALANIVVAKKKTTRIVLLFWLILAFLLVFFTSSRGGWLGTFVSLVVFSIGLSISKWQWIKERISSLIKKKIVLVVIALAGAAVITAAFLLLRWQSSHPTHPTDWTNIFGSRDYIWRVGREMFTNNLIAGNGIFTYGTEFLKIEPIPPNTLLAHAHNLYLNIAGEQGLIGVLCYGIYIYSLIRLMLSAWREHSNLSQIEVAGLAGALFGLAAHSLFETPQSLPVLLILPAIIVAQIAAGVNRGQETVKPLVKNMLLAGFWILSAALMIFDIRAGLKYEKGLTYAANQNWIDSSQLMEQATSLDPSNALYWFQKGQVYGQGALDEFGQVIDQTALENAIDSYHTGLEIEYEYSVNWMNLGLLYQAAGDFESALYSMKVAEYQSPAQPAFHLTIGNLYEQLDQVANSEVAYKKALAIKPDLVDTIFFRENEFRKNITGQWLAQADYSNLKPDGLDKIWQMYQAGEYLEALDLIQGTSKFNNPEAFWLEGKIYTQLANYPAAERSLRTANWMGTTNGTLRAEILIGLGEVSLLQGNQQDAFEAYSAAYTLLEGTTSYGVGEKGETQYSWYLFYKNSLKQDLLPGIIYPVYSNEMFNGLRFLLKWYCENNQSDMASEIYGKIVSIRPDVSDAAAVYYQSCAD